MRKLFVSFTSLVAKIKEGKVSESDLATGLFYFGCVKANVLDSPEHNEIAWFYRDDPSEGRRVHQMIVAAVEKADAEGRTAWRELRGRNTVTQLNQLLHQNGVKRLRTPPSGWYDYSYPFVEHLVRESTRPLEVVR